MWARDDAKQRENGIFHFLQHSRIAIRCKQTKPKRGWLKTEEEMLPLLSPHAKTAFVSEFSWNEASDWCDVWMEGREKKFQKFNTDDVTRKASLSLSLFEVLFEGRQKVTSILWWLIYERCAFISSSTTQIRMKIFFHLKIDSEAAWGHINLIFPFATLCATVSRICEWQQQQLQSSFFLHFE